MSEWVGGSVSGWVAGWEAWVGEWWGGWVGGGWARAHRWYGVAGRPTHDRQDDWRPAGRPNGQLADSGAELVGATHGGATTERKCTCYGS